MKLRAALVWVVVIVVFASLVALGRKGSPAHVQLSPLVKHELMETCAVDDFNTLRELLFYAEQLSQNDTDREVVKACSEATSSWDAAKSQYEAPLGYKLSRHR